LPELLFDNNFTSKGVGREWGIEILEKIFSGDFTFRKRRTGKIFCDKIKEFMGGDDIVL
jgi:hypothetical protein